MKFCTIDKNSLNYHIVELNGLYSWQQCNETEKGFISLKTAKNRGIDVYKITVQFSDEPKPQIRIVAEIWNSKLLETLQKEGFKTYDVPIAKGRVTTGVETSCEAICDFDETPASKARALNFLTTLVYHSKMDSIASNESEIKSLMTISDQIDLLAKHYDTESLSVGTQWTKTAKETKIALKIQDEKWQERKCDLIYCGFFAASMVAVAGGLAALSTVSLAIP